MDRTKRIDGNVFCRKQQKIINCQNEKFDQYESTRMTTMAEMKFIENKLQSFDINAQPPVTHTQIEKLKKVSRREFHHAKSVDGLFKGCG